MCEGQVAGKPLKNRPDNINVLLQHFTHSLLYLGQQLHRSVTRLSTQIFYPTKFKTTISLGKCLPQNDHVPYFDPIMCNTLHNRGCEEVLLNTCVIFGTHKLGKFPLPNNSYTFMVSNHVLPNYGHFSTLPECKTRNSIVNYCMCKKLFYEIDVQHNIGLKTTHFFCTQQNLTPISKRVSNNTQTADLLNHICGQFTCFCNTVT